MLIIKNANLMAVFSKMGEIDGALRPEEGVYLLDTKIVKRLKLCINDGKTVQMGMEVNGDGVVFWELSGFDGEEYAVLIKKAFRALPNGLLVDVRVRNLKSERVRLSVACVIDYTCNDIFEVRQSVSYFNVESAVSTHEGSKELSNSQKIFTEGRTMECVSDFSKIRVRHDLPESLDVELEAREVREYRFKIEAEAFFTSESKATQIFSNEPSPRLVLSTNTRGKLRKLLKQSVDDINFLLLSTKFGAVPAAGTPWFSTIFGRDTLIFSLQCLERFPNLVKNILEVHSFLQARAFDPWREMEPGKIVHEIRTGQLSLSGKLPFAFYYGSVDATPLYILVMHAYWKFTGDDEFVERHLGDLNGAFGWIFEYGDVDKDGYVEYRSRSVLRNQGWKDSSRSVVKKDGSHPLGPIALSEVQAYVYGAIKAMIDFERCFGLGLNVEKLEEDMNRLKARFNRDFWLEDEQYFALALDGEKKPVDSVTSNPAHGLLTGIIESEKAEKLVQRLFARDMFSGWGVRTMSSEMKAYNPFSYHNGSIWPHDNSLIIKGLLNYGYIDDAKKLSRVLLKAAEFFDYRLPELYSGLEGPRPLPYPVSCSPQLWAAGSAFVIADALEKY